MMRARMYVCVCASVRIRAFFTRVNSGALHLWLTRRCIVFCREEKNGLCSTVKRPAKLASPPHPSTPRVRTTHFFPPELCPRTGRNPTLFSHMDRRKREKIVSRVTILLVFNPRLTVTNRCLISLFTPGILSSTTFDKKEEK